MGLAQRSVTSSAWNFIVNIIRLPVALVQAIILARLLPVEYFGIVAGIIALVKLSAIFFEFGFRSAYLHRAPETQDEETATAVLFTLRIIFFSVWLIGLVIFGFLFLSDIHLFVLFVIGVTTFFSEIINTSRDVLIRRVQHRRIAILDLTTNIIVFGISVLVAYWTGSIWALLIVYVVSPIWTAIVLFVWRPVWQPRLALNREMGKYYLKFGGRVFTGDVLGVSLDKVDDLWTNIFLGDRSLGFYSRAYQFAVYPRIILANPVNAVTAGTYSELKYDRRRLSQAFNMVNALLIRSGFLLAGLLALIAPNFISLFLGERWMPMLDAFRVMLVYTLLDPIKITIASILVAVGKPERVTLARGIQLIVLIIGLFAAGLRFDILGVALAVDLMLVVGIVVLLYFVRPYVDYSIKDLFAIPLLALVVGIGANYIVVTLVSFPSSDWWAMIIKSAIFIIVYLGILMTLAGKSLIEDNKQIIKLFLRSGEKAQQNQDVEVVVDC